MALSNKGRIFGCGYQGSSLPLAATDEFMEKAKFKQIEIDSKIISINCGLSGAGAISREGYAYVWGRFGKVVFNVPKKLSKINEDIVSRHE